MFPECINTLGVAYPNWHIYKGSYELTVLIYIAIEGHSGGKWYVGIAEEDYCLTKSWLLAYKSYHVKYLGYVWKFDMIRLTV